MGVGSRWIPLLKDTLAWPSRCGHAEGSSPAHLAHDVALRVDLHHVPAAAVGADALEARADALHLATAARARALHLLHPLHALHALHALRLLLRLGGL
jgi:hypothetical protein